MHAYIGAWPKTGPYPCMHVESGFIHLFFVRYPYFSLQDQNIGLQGMNTQTSNATRGRGQLLEWKFASPSRCNLTRSAALPSRDQQASTWPTQDSCATDGPPRHTCNTQILAFFSFLDFLDHLNFGRFGSFPLFWILKHTHAKARTNLFLARSKTLIFHKTGFELKLK
jgi:hypothetical protein